MAMDGVCCGYVPAHPRVCRRGFLGRVLVSVQHFLALLASSYGARQNTLARDQTEWVAGRPCRLIFLWGIHLSVNGSLWGRSESKCLARLQGQLFFSATCRIGRLGIEGFSSMSDLCSRTTTILMSPSLLCQEPAMSPSVPAFPSF